MIQGLTTYQRLTCPAAKAQTATRLPRVCLRPGGKVRLQQRILRTSTLIYSTIFYYTLLYFSRCLRVSASLQARSLSRMKPRTRDLLECGDSSPLSLKAPSHQVPLCRFGTRRSVRTSRVPTKNPLGRIFRATTPSRLKARNLTLYQCFGMSPRSGAPTSSGSAPATGASKTHSLSLFCVRHAWSHRNPNLYQCFRTLGHRT